MQLLVTFQKGHGETGKQLVYPLTEIPEESSIIVSPRVGDHHGVPAPSMPGGCGFDDLLYEVAHVRDDVLSGKWPYWLFEKYDVPANVPKPLRAAGISEDNPAGAAHIVHMDKPIDLGAFILDWLLLDGAKLRNNYGHNGVPFLETIPGFLQVLSIEVALALEVAFQVKYYYGRPRPEEIFGFNCTQYLEGCPCHPEYVAGHGAVSGATNKAVNKWFSLTPSQEKEVEVTTKHFAIYRTLAGVHYMDANLQGWKLGNGDYK